MAEILRVIREVYALLKYINLDYHPNDSRIGIKQDDVCQSLTGRMGTGGGNVPLILAIHETEEQTDDSLRSSIEG